MVFGRLATVCGALVCTVIAAPALAQDKPFVFTTATATDITRPQARVDYEVGTADQAFQSDSAFQPEQRVNVQASLGRVTLIGRFGVSQVGSAYQSSQAGEALFTLTSSTARMSIAAGGGVEHEAAGTNVLMSRIVVGSASDNWLSQGNVVLQHPLAPGRDPLDVLLTGGLARRIAAHASVGLEGVGEDLEGFWNPAEAEGGARLLIGPSFHLSSAGGTWQFLCAGGPELHPRPTDRSSDAIRDLPPTTHRVSYAVQAGLSLTFGK